MNMHTIKSSIVQEALFRRVDISPEEFFQALGRARRAARDEVERLIEWLDSTIDCDEDASVDDQGCDSDDFEPALGSFDRMSNQIKAWQGGSLDVDAELDESDREECGDDEPLVDDEPSLCGLNAGYGGESGFGNDTDRELEGRPDPKKFKAQQERYNRGPVCNVRPLIGGTII